MKITLRTLLALVVLTPCIAASGSNVPGGLSPVNVHDSIGDLSGQLSAVHLTEGKDIKTAVLMLDEKIAKATRQSNDYNSAAVLVQEFFSVSVDTTEQAIDDIVKTALATNSFNLLQALQHINVWSSPEQFHWFQALGYKSKWYNPHLWQVHSMDWSKYLHAIFVADNPALLKDIMSSVLAENPLTIDTDTLLNLIAKHDSLAIYQSLYPTFITTQLKTLAESGSFKILRFLVESQSIDLHLEDYSLPEALPTNFGLFWTQGYCYMPVSQILKKACEQGRLDIIELFYQLDPKILNPTSYLPEAAKKGHLDILYWAIERNLEGNKEGIVVALIIYGPYKLFDEQLREKLGISMDILKKMSTRAVVDQFHIVEWLYEKFNVVPESSEFGKAGIKALEWLKSVAPQEITPELASRANLDGLKWLSENYPQVLTDDVKNAQNTELIDLEKMFWMISQGWKADLDMVAAAWGLKMETLKFGYFDLHMKPTEEEASIVALGGYTDVLKIIYSIDPSCIRLGCLLRAIGFAHLETAKYCESILNLKNTKLDFDLDQAVTFDSLETIKWVYQEYPLSEPKDSWLLMAVLLERFHMVDWAIEKQLILKTDEEYLMHTASCGEHAMFERLVAYGIPITEPEDYTKLAFKAGSLGLIKYFVKEYPGIAQSLKDEEVTIKNWHIVQWLRNHGYLSENAQVLDNVRALNDGKVGGISHRPCCIL